MRSITAEEHQKIAEAIRQAEAQTAGEIYCVVARSSDGYFFPSALVASISIIVASLLLAFALEYWWVSIRLPIFAGAELLALVASLLLLHALPTLRVRLTPRHWQFTQAHDNALKQFLARNVHLTAERTGVLIFVSLAERYAEVVADTGINGRVGQDVWNDVVAGLIQHARGDRLADGFVQAVGTVGALLAQHFPVQPGDINELDDHLVEI